MLRFVGTDGPRNQIDNDWNNFQPRVGFAYSVGPATVVRGGYGLFYGAMPVRRLGSIGFDTETPWVTSLDGLAPTNYLRDPFPQGFNLPTGKRDPLTNVGFNLDSTTRSNPVGHTQQWSLSARAADRRPLRCRSGLPGEPGHRPAVRRRLSAQLARTRVPRARQSAQRAGPESFLRHHPQRPALFTHCGAATTAAAVSTIHIRGAAVSECHHLPSTMRWSSRPNDESENGLTFLGSYVWSTLRDDGSEPVGGLAILNYYDLPAEHSLSTFDVGTTWWSSAVYDLPFGRGQRFASSLPAVAEAIVGGWTVAAIARWQSGFPVVIGRPAVRDDRSAALDEPTIRALVRHLGVQPPRNRSPLATSPVRCPTSVRTA